MKKLTTTEDIASLLTASTFSFALGAALETGLLERLAEKPMSCEEVSQVMNIPGKRGYYWLQMLTELGILENDSRGYTPTSIMRDVISDKIRLKRWKHIASDERELQAGVRNFAPYISETSIWKAQGLPEATRDYEKIEVDPERARVFTRLLYKFYQDSRKAIVDSLDMTGVGRMMDIGGGSGIASIFLTQKYPELKSVIVDFKNVCAEGQVIVEENQLSDRITFHGANFLTDELPQGFDLVLHCDIGVFGVDLFRKLWTSLKPEGRIVVAFQFPPSENVAPAPYLKWAFLDSLKNPDFGFPTVAQLQDQLVQAGFHLLPDVYTTPDGYDGCVIQARKTGE